MKRLTVPSPLGDLTLIEDAGVLIAVDWGGVERDETPLLTRARRQLDEYFSNRRREFDLPLSPSGTAFQRRVWDRMRRIPYGETLTYGDMARAIGSAPRAVGGACGANPLPIFIPCHRVIGAGGSLGGYSGGAGRSIKVALLELESRRNLEPLSQAAGAV